MGETLFIRLGSQFDSKIHWLVKTNGQEEIIASGELPNAGELTQLTAKAKSRDIVTFVPACDIAIKSLTVPGSSQRAIRLAAPYMLEDELAQDVEQLFFAFSEQKQNEQGNNCFIAALEREQLSLWQQWLKAADIFCKIMIPDALALPVNAEHYTAVMLDDQFLMRLDTWQVMSFESNAWPFIAAQLNNSTAKTIQAYSPLANLPDDLSVEFLPEELPLAILANHHSVKFNLLQGEFQVKEKRSATSTNWLWVAGFAVFALVLNFTLKGSELYRLSNQQAAVEQEIVASYKSAFPDAKRVNVATIRSQLKRKLTEVGNSGDSAGFLPLLINLEPALASVPEIEPQTLKFDGKRKEVRMQAVAKDYQYFEKLKVALEKSGLSVNLGAQNNQGEQISGSFSISDNSSKGRS